MASFYFEQVGEFSFQRILNKSTLFAFNYSIRCHAIHRARGQPYFRSLTLICSHQMLKTNNQCETIIMKDSRKPVTSHHFNPDCHIILCQSNRRGLDSHYHVPQWLLMLPS
ncbi:hypothetical protein T08_2525 [Trichinella sp. T8]|nr:hypothetical protein T08_16221 [Trichinella sp. T8]KRZ88370.1 hypothetical protein T08_2525 [Trichinella sp. T8]